MARHPASPTELHFAAEMDGNLLRFKSQKVRMLALLRLLQQCEIDELISIYGDFLVNPRFDASSKRVEVTSALLSPINPCWWSIPTA